MILGKKVVVILPAYNAEKTLRNTVAEVPEGVDEIILVDDASSDGTVRVAHELGLKTFLLIQNLGYGGNQKACYRQALREGADIVVMVHPDYQYDPRLVAPMAAMIASGVYDVVLGSRILGKTALSGGMPLYKYLSNRFLTWFQNLMLGQKLSEYHTGLRAFSREVLEKLPLEANSNDFAFDNQVLTQVCAFHFRVGEVSCPTRYFPEASSISFKRSVIYGWACLLNSLVCRLHRMGLVRPAWLTPRVEA